MVLDGGVRVRLLDGEAPCLTDRPRCIASESLFEMSMQGIRALMSLAAPVVTMAPQNRDRSLDPTGCRHTESESGNTNETVKEKEIGSLRRLKERRIIHYRLHPPRPERSHLDIAHAPPESAHPPQSVRVRPSTRYPSRLLLKYSSSRLTSPTMVDGSNGRLAGECMITSS